MGLNKDATKELMLGVYGADFPYDEYKAEMSALFHEQAAGGKLPMKPGVTGLLQTLKKNGRKVALASSTRKAVVEQELRDAGILPYFDRVICGDMVKRSKPEPDIYLEACRQIHVMPEQAYAIEDSYNGIRSAHAAGLHPIMVPDLAPVTEEMQELSDVILYSIFICNDLPTLYDQQLRVEYNPIHIKYNRFKSFHHSHQTFSIFYSFQ